jgi:hypothetical protein
VSAQAPKEDFQPPMTSMTPYMVGAFGFLEKRLLLSVIDWWFTKAWSVGISHVNIPPDIKCIAARSRSALR